MQPLVETNAISPMVLFNQRDGFPAFRRWTKKEYHRLAELGFFDNMRVEYIDGEIVVNTDYQITRNGDKIFMTMNNPHAVAIRLILAVLHNVFGEGFVIDSQLPMNLGDNSEPEPDVAVIRGFPRDFLNSHPTSAALLIEVAESTLSFDRNRKASLYARHNIEDYWIINLKNNSLEIYRRPLPDEDAHYGFAYSEKSTFLVGDEVSPLAKPAAKIKVADLLP